MVDTQTSTSDRSLDIYSERSGTQRVHLGSSDMQRVDGTFNEAKNIDFTYRLDEGEKYCNLRIPKCKDRITREDSGDARTFKYRWMPINFAGVFDVVLEIIKEDKTNEPKKTYTLRLDVLSKFDEGRSNHSNFLFMLNSIREKHLEIFSLFNPSRIPKTTGKTVPPTPLEQFNVLEHNMEELENIVYQISLNPNKRLIKETRRDNFYALDIVDHNVVYDIATQRGGLIEVKKESVPNDLQKWFVDNEDIGYLPDSVIIYRTAPTFNVYENQLLKRFLTLITICAKLVETRLEQEKFKELEKNEIEEIDKRIQKCKEFHRKAQYMKRYSFLDEVQETDNIAYHTPVLQREVNYMRFYDIFKDFIREPLFDFSEVLNLPILDIPTLYEYWGVIQIVDILNNLQGWDKKLHIKQENELFGYLFRLKSGDNSLIELCNGEKKVCLFYQKEYRTYAGRRLKPDVTLEMKVNGKCKVLVLDPKYRSDLGAKDSNDPENAINKMHVYKDAIRAKDGSHIVEAAYAIFLGDDDPQDYKEIGIGGIRLLPKEGDDAGLENLNEIIQRFIDKTY